MGIRSPRTRCAARRPIFRMMLVPEDSPVVLRRSSCRFDAVLQLGQAVQKASPPLHCLPDPDADRSPGPDHTVFPAPTSFLSSDGPASSAIPAPSILPLLALFPASSILPLLALLIAGIIIVRVVFRRVIRDVRARKATGAGLLDEECHGDHGETDKKIISRNEDTSGRDRQERGHQWREGVCETGENEDTSARDRQERGHQWREGVCETGENVDTSGRAVEAAGQM